MSIALLRKVISPTTISYPIPSDAYYLSPVGSNSNDGQTAPWLTLDHAASALPAGKTLVIEDGDYSGVANQITSANYFASGSAAAFTTIRARNIPGADGYPVTNPCAVHFRGDAGIKIQSAAANMSYVKWHGLRLDNTNIHTNVTRNYWKQCAFQGTIDTGDGNQVAAGINGSYNLVEDCVGYGRGRYKFLSYGYGAGETSNLFRRVIVRPDEMNLGHLPTGNPIAAFCSYHSLGTVYLNCMVFDGDPNNWIEDPGQLAGGFYQPNDSTPGYAMHVEGFIIVDFPMCIGFTQGGSGHIFKDGAAVRVGGGLYMRGDVDINNIAIVDLGSDNYSYLSPIQASRILAKDQGLIGDATTINLNDSIMRDILSNAVNSGTVYSDYINMYAIGGSQYAGGSTPAPNLITTDPFLNGLKYPPRIESGYSLYTAGSGGGILGPTIMNKLGPDGAFADDPNFNTPQGALWPWELEEWALAEFRRSEYTTESTTGVCSAGETITHRVFNALGNGNPI